MIESGTLKLSTIGVVPRDPVDVEYMRLTHESIYDVLAWIKKETTHGFSRSWVEGVSIPSDKVSIYFGDYLVLVNGGFIGMTEDKFNQLVEPNYQHQHETGEQRLKA